MEIIKFIFKSLVLLGILFLFYILGLSPFGWGDRPVISRIIPVVFYGIRFFYTEAILFVGYSSAKFLLPFFIFLGNLLSIFFMKRFLYKDIVVKNKNIINFLAIIFISISFIFIYFYINCQMYQNESPFEKNFRGRVIENLICFYPLNCIFMLLFVLKRKLAMSHNNSLQPTKP